jgi:hypothetical protein
MGLSAHGHRASGVGSQARARGGARAGDGLRGEGFQGHSGDGALKRIMPENVPGRETEGEGGSGVSLAMCHALYAVSPDTQIHTHTRV